MFGLEKFLTGYEKGEVKKRKIVETENISVDEKITMISEMIPIIGKKEGEST
jgi:transposase